VHKTANVLDKMPKPVQPQAKRMLHSIWDAPTKGEANIAFDLFVNTFEAKHSSAVDCLRKDRDVLLTFYDFPAENWCHIRTTNPIESTFATIRLRHRKTKNNGSAKASLVMIFKLAQCAEKGWRKLRGHQHIPELIRGIHFIDGVSEHSINNHNSTTTKPLHLIPKSSPERFSTNTIFGSNSGRAHLSGRWERCLRIWSNWKSNCHQY